MPDPRENWIKLVGILRIFGSLNIIVMWLIIVRFDTKNSRLVRLVIAVQRVNTNCYLDEADREICTHTVNI